MLILLVMAITPTMILGCATETATTTKIVKDVTAQEAFNLIKENTNNPDFIIVDVRTPREFADGHIENAINIDFDSKTFRSQLLQSDKNKTYLVYCDCAGGGKAEKTALIIMKAFGFKETYYMWDGIDGWEREGFPTESSNES